MNNYPEARVPGLGERGTVSSGGHSCFSGSAREGGWALVKDYAVMLLEMGEGALSQFCGRATKLSLLQPPEKEGKRRIRSESEGGVWDTR